MRADSVIPCSDAMKLSNNIIQIGLAFGSDWSGTVVNSGRLRTLRDPAPPACWPRWGFGGGGTMPPGTKWRISMSKSATKRLAAASSAATVAAAKPSQQPTAAPKSDKAEPGSKQSRVIAMLRSPSGATIAAIMKATGWQQHSVRGFLAGVVRKRLKLKLDSKKVDSNRVYQIAGGASSKPRPRKATRQSA